MKKILKVLALICWMGLIFYFSNQNGTASSELSDGLLTLVFKNLNDNSVLFIVIRKCAHFFLYFVLAILCDINFKEYTNKHFIYSLLFVLLFAISDEYHQSFIPGREAELTDVLIDSTASILALLLKNKLSSIVNK